MKAVLHEFSVSLKHDLLNKVAPNIACNVFDQWWEEAANQFKVIFYLL